MPALQVHGSLVPFLVRAWHLRLMASEWQPGLAPPVSLHPTLESCAICAIGSAGGESNLENTYFSSKLNSKKGNGRKPQQSFVCHVTQRASVLVDKAGRGDEQLCPPLPSSLLLSKFLTTSSRK